MPTLPYDTHLAPESVAAPDVLRRDERRVFAEGWVSIGVGAHAPLPGDVRPVQVAGQPLMIVRDLDARIQVFFNVCRHRGTQLVDSACHQGNGIITCPYHTWSYGLDGGLRGTPYWDRTRGSAPSEQVMSRLALQPVRFALWFDTIYVNLSGTAPPFEEFIAPLAQRWRSFDAAQVRLLTAQDYRPAANWKLVIENFLDGYHIPWVHSQVGPPEAGADYQTANISADIFGAFVPQGGKERPRIDDPLPSFADVAADYVGSHHFVYVYPNTLVSLGEQWFQVINLLPQSAESTLEHLALYLVSDTAMTAERETQRAAFAAQMLQINEQDMEILARLQNGRTSTAAAHCTFAPHWDELASIFHARMDRALSQDPVN